MEGHGCSPFECIVLYLRLCVWTEKTTKEVRTAKVNCKTRAQSVNSTQIYEIREVLDAAYVKILAFRDFTVPNLVQSFHVPKRHSAST